jgi:hypothetical protein
MRSRLAPSMTAAFGATVVFYLLLALAAPFVGSSGVGRLTLAIFRERGVIPYLLTFGFFVGAALAALRAAAIRREARSLGEIESAIDAIGDAPGVVHRIRRAIADDASNASLTADRVARVIERGLLARDGAELDGAIDRIAEADARAVEASHLPARYLIWLIPTLGFIGTVLGISRSVEGFAAALDRVEDFARLRGNLLDICIDLGAAFETTLLALIMSAALAAAGAGLDRAESSLLARLDALCALDLRSLLAGSIAVASSPAPIAADGRSATTIVLRANARNETDLIEVAEEAVARAVARLAGAGEAAGRALENGAQAGRLGRLLEADLATNAALREWIARATAEMRDADSRNGRLEALLAQSALRERRIEAALGRLAAALEGLHRRGVPVRLAVRAETGAEAREGAPS